MKQPERKRLKNEWKRAWSYRCKTKRAMKEKRAIKKRAHKRARKGDGKIRLDGWEVI
jgi:hypothetical protein